MGTEFIRKAAPAFRKSWDRRAVELATPDLFTQQPICAAQTAAADIIGHAALKLGDVLIVRLMNNRLTAFRGITEVARFSTPSTELIDAVRSTYGMAKGIVEQVHELAGVVEISIC